MFIICGNQLLEYNKLARKITSNFPLNRLSHRHACQRIRSQLQSKMERFIGAA
jgi:hypothetical protein